MKVGRLLYRCRLCGTIEDGAGTSADRVQGVALDIIINDHSGPGIPCGRLGLHSCGETRTGVTDFIGFKIVEER
jgi:hypothetical protein